MVEIKDLDYYRKQPYTKRAHRETEEGETYWVAVVDELPGCVATGANKAEAYANLNDAFDAWVIAKLEWGSLIPEPDRGGIQLARAAGIANVDDRIGLASNADSSGFMEIRHQA